MAEDKDKAGTKTTSGDAAAGNTAVPKHGVPDRVAMLSVNADGTLDQRNPEIIGDKQFALDATREQFKQQAVSAVDAERARDEAGGVEAPDATEDPADKERREAHEAAASEAEKAAERTVGALFVGDDEKASK
jgi:hypothetical protein